MPLVSIIVPVYNVEQKLDRCLKTLSDQTIKDIEVLLINDGSTDNSGKICDQFSEKDSRFKTIHISNAGVSSARNLGIKNANSKYIMFVDSDDEVDVTILEQMLDENKRNDFDFIMCGYKRIIQVQDIVEKNRLLKLKNIQVMSNVF